MRTWNVTGMALGSMLLGSAGAFAAPTAPLWISDDAGRIGTVDLSTGIVTVIGSSGVGALTDIGFSSAGALYGTTFGAFYAVNSTTGAATLVGSYGVAGNGGMNALVGAPGGLFYAASSSTSALYSIGTAPFAITALSGSTGGGASGDLAFGPASTTLYESLSNGNLSRITVSGGTVTSSIVGNTGLGTLYGLATGDDGVTYAVAGTEIYSINLSTAALTPLLNYGNHGLSTAFGSAFFAESRVTAVPEPATLALMGAGLLGLGMTRRRSRS